MRSFQLYKWRSLTVSLLLFLTAAPLSWSATISGRVYDAVNDIYLESARVSLSGTNVQTVTDRRGNYRLTGVEPGEYVVVAQVSGRPPIRNNVVIDAAFDEKVVNFTITQEDIFDLEEFVVEGSLIGTAKSLDIRRSASDYREVIASDAFGQFTDRNPAEALQRVAGVTVESDQGEGSFILIRGGSPDLSNIQIDGVNLATPEEDGRQVNLNVITVDQLERIELSKTWLPSQSANVIAGTVNMITRSALDRGERYASIEGAYTQREIAEDEDSWRYAVTYGDFWEKGDREGLSWLSDDFAVGFQISVNQSEDFLGSDTVTWGWIVDKDYPFLTDPGEERPWGFTLDNLAKRNFNIDRERTGGSARLEIRFNNNHEVHASMSSNKFDDISREHIFDQDTQSLAQFYSGETFLTLPIAEELGLDLNDPFVAQRLALGPPNFNAALTYNEAIQLGELEYDPELRLFTRGGLWGMEMFRYFNHRVKNDKIDTLNFGGEHTFWGDIDLDWTVYSSEASQNSERRQLEFSLDGLGGGVTGTGGFPLAGPAVQNPYILDARESPTIFSKISFKMKEPTNPNVGPGILLVDLYESIDERKGYEANLEKQLEAGSTLWTIAIGAAKDERDKTYKVDQNDYGLNGQGSLDPEFWPNPNRQASLEDEFFDGGEIEGFEDNFGEGLRFGPSFHEENTLAFMRDPASYGADFGQDVNHLNDNFTSRVRLNYDATEDVTAYYFQQTIDWRKWKFIFGVRYEKTENTFTNLQILTRNPDLPPTIPFIRPGFWRLLRENEEFGEESFARQVTNERDYDHYLPALHVIRNIGDNIVVRASATKTIARPKFTDLIPREIPSISGSNFGTTLQLPAFDLVPMESTNYDLSVDYYLEPIGVFSAAVFYKDLTGPIYEENRYEVGPNDETAVYAEKYTSTGQNNSSWTLSQFRNSGEGKLMGVELTFDRQLNFLPSFLNGLGVNSNIAFFDSEATLVTDLRVGEVVPLFKQPDMTANVSLYYDKHGLFARLSYNYRGEYLNSIVAGRGTLLQHERLGIPAGSRDIYVAGTGRVDFTMRYKITPSLQVFLEAINLTNEPVERVIQHESLPVFKQYTERVFTIGLKWNL